LDPMKARMDAIESFADHTVRYEIQPSVLGLTAQDALQNALGLVAESIKPNYTYLMDFVGDIDGTMDVEYNGQVLKMSAGEQLKLRTNANGDVIFCEVYTNPIQEIYEKFEGRFQEIKTRGVELSTAADVMETVTTQKVDDAATRLSDLFGITVPAA
ncbi:MAG: hypothetical protein ACRCXK_10530, partial [Wohlfahrtiimonas sp.]